MHTRTLFLLISINLCLAATQAQDKSEPDHAHHHSANPAVSKGHEGVGALSPELRSVLSEEMKMLQDAVEKIPGLLAQGEHHEVAVAAHRMQNGFILKQKLTADQIAELHAKLPEDFIRRDQRFHQLAGKLHDAAHDDDSELSLYYFSRMLESCVSCHATHAGERFPKLVPKVATQPHHH
ncbi:hypothetical protein SCOR_24370 [Sulfidibacter corallicola]|uniref:Cytochrome c n=1 Tax=Sulfidibacter corallicola TaxID=2818388 RepID=A0A8A4U136_SULCO|nr:hypothetical protein [Sulfidibacter corallicola]QTD52455.1 hypothetical protein J3U87_08285 [Sulfidibacter corallicola]